MCQWLLSMAPSGNATMMTITTDDNTDGQVRCDSLECHTWHLLDLLLTLLLLLSFSSSSSSYSISLNQWTLLLLLLLLPWWPAVTTVHVSSWVAFHSLPVFYNSTEQTVLNTLSPSLHEVAFVFTRRNIKSLLPLSLFSCKLPLLAPAFTGRLICEQQLFSHHSVILSVQLFLSNTLHPLTSQVAAVFFFYFVLLFFLATFSLSHSLCFCARVSCVCLSFCLSTWAIWVIELAIVDFEYTERHTVA